MKRRGKGIYRDLDTELGRELEERERELVERKKERKRERERERESASFVPDYGDTFSPS